MTKQNIDLGFVPQSFPEGTHMCLIYKDDEERENVISQYLLKGLLNNEKVSYFALQASKEEVLTLLKKSGVVLNEQNLDVLSAQETYCPNNIFVPEEMLETLRQFYNSSIENGYKSCRVSGEMHWALQQIPGSERLMEYEALLNNVSITHPVTALCQYDSRKFSGETIIECLKVHPYMIINGQVIENPYYMSPEEFLKQR
jgi:hypothetical protein